MSSYTTIEFDDYSGEWLIPVLIADDNKEELPLFICRNDEDNEETVTTKTSYLGKKKKLDPWHKPLSDNLQLIAMLCNKAYLVFKVNDLDAYHLIWARFNKSMAYYVFSADCDLKLLGKKLSESCFLDAETIKKIANWGYGQADYGADYNEHYACYHARNPQYIDAFQKYLSGENFEKRYERLHCHPTCITQDIYENYDDVTDFLTLKMKYHNEKKCYVLYRNSPYSNINIKTIEDYKQWLDYYYENDPYISKENDDELKNGFKELLQCSENERSWLDILLSFPSVSAFEFNNHQFKLICVDDLNVIQTLFAQDETDDYIDGFFSIDTDIVQLRKHITEHGSYNTERLLKLGNWAIVNQIDDIDYWRFIISSKDKTDFAKQISKYKTVYIKSEANTRPTLKK